jgi:hypothetical protein
MGNVQNCDSCTNLLQFSVEGIVISEVVSDLLASKDLFLICGQKTTTFSYIQSEWPQEDKVTMGDRYEFSEDVNLSSHTCSCHNWCS